VVPLDVFDSVHSHLVSYKGLYEQISRFKFPLKLTLVNDIEGNLIVEPHTNFEIDFVVPAVFASSLHAGLVQPILDVWNLVQ
jgi:hypothetical protein